MQRPVISNLSFSGNYNLNNTTFIEATYGRSRNELAGCALAQTGTGPNLCRNAIVMNPGSNKNNIGLGGLPMLFPDANKLNPDYYAYEALNKMNPAPPAWVNGEFLKPPTFAWGNRVGSAPPSLPFPSVLQRERHPGPRGQPDQGQGASHDQDGLLQHAQLQGGAGDERPVLGRTELRAGHRRDQPLRHVLWIRQCRDRRLQLLPAGLELRRRQLRLRQPRSLHPGQLAREQPADARLRHALRERGAAVRQPRTGIQLPAREVGAGHGPRALCPGLRRRTGTGNRLSGRKSTGPESSDRPAPRSELVARDRDAGAQLGQPDQRVVQGRRRDRRHDLYLPDARVRAALRHGLRPDRQPDDDPARRDRDSSTTGRSATRSSAWRAIRLRRDW